MTNKDLVLRISYFRNKQNLSSRELSLRIGKNEGYISKLESYDFNLTTKILLDILEALNVSVEDFFCLGEEYTAESKNILKLFNNLSSSNKQTIIDLMKKLQ